MPASPAPLMTVVGPAAGCVLFDWDALDEPRCRVCGCTEDNACPSAGDPDRACGWAEHGLCTECHAWLDAHACRAPRVDPAETAILEGAKHELRRSLEAALLAVEGLGVVPPPSGPARDAYVSTLLAAASRVDEHAHKTYHLAIHLYDRVSGILSADARKETPVK